MNTHPGSYLDELQEQLQQLVIDGHINEEWPFGVRFAKFALR